MPFLPTASSNSTDCSKRCCPILQVSKVRHRGLGPLPRGGRPLQSFSISGASTTFPAPEALLCLSPHPPPPSSSAQPGPHLTGVNSLPLLPWTSAILAHRTQRRRPAQGQSGAGCFLLPHQIQWVGGSPQGTTSMGTHPELPLNTMGPLCAYRVDELNERMNGI